MITGFEAETFDLTEHEYALMPYIIKSLKKKIGKENSITNVAMCKGLIENYMKLKDPQTQQPAFPNGISISPPRMRKIISYIRINHLIEGLMATSTGYYITKDKAEVEKYINSLKQRIAAILAVQNSFEEYLIDLINDAGDIAA